MVLHLQSYVLLIEYLIGEVGDVGQATLTLAISRAGAPMKLNIEED